MAVQGEEARDEMTILYNNFPIEGLRPLFFENFLCTFFGFCKN